MRARLVGATVVTLTAVLMLLGTYFIRLQRDLMLERRDAERARMYDELRQKALAVTSNVAVASERALSVRDYLFLMQIVSSTQGNVQSCAYGALVDKEGRVSTHTNPKLASKVLEGPDELAARAPNAPTVRMTTYEGKPVMEALAPVTIADEVWGTARFGFYTDALNNELAAFDEEMNSRIRGAIASTLLILGVVIAAGVLLGTVAARALTRPLASLHEAVQDVREGKSQVALNVRGSAEIVALADGFNEMSQAVRKREDALRMALAKADEASRLKSEFLANISHELRTPLNAIINVPGALLGDFPTALIWSCAACTREFEPDAGESMVRAQPCPVCGVGLQVKEAVLFTGDPETHRHFNQRALSSAQHLLRVVNDLLDFSRLQAHKTELSVADVMVQRLVGDVRDTMMTLASAKDIDLRFVIDAPHLILHVDRVKMGQVIINLLGNAIKFTPEHGTVTLQVSQESEDRPDQAHIQVRDTGIGIPQDQLTAIFEPFRQVDGSHTRTYGGSGLGLTITAQLVELHGGRIWVESVVGSGSTFHVVIPLSVPGVAKVEDPAMAVAASAPGPAASSRHVVLLDDDDTYLRLGRHMLEKAGFQVTTLADPSKAVALIAEVKPALLIVDMMMPHFSGIEVIRQIRASAPGRDLPIIVSSAYHASCDVVEQLEAKWLPKPWTAEQLLDYLTSNALLPPPPPSEPAAGRSLAST
jgi:signal transduction histidine kinase/ActR/RegA family two-component response regulator